MTKMWSLTDGTMMELITEYKKHPLLWDKEHENYDNISHKAVGYNKLLEIVTREVPVANCDFVVKKMNAMKKSVIHCHKKMCNSANKSYKPTLWYYEHMKFVAESPFKKNDKQSNENFTHESCKAQYLSEDLFAEFINLYKENECLWNKNNPLYFNTNLKSDAYNKLLELVTREIAAADKSYVVKKLNSIRQYVKNHFRKSDPKKNSKVNLKYYEMLKFLVDSKNSNDEMENELSSQETNESGDEELQIPNVILNDFIAAYKEFPCLWDKKSYSYNKVRQCNKAYDKLLILIKPYIQNPSPNWSFLKTQINILRNNAIREYKNAMEDQTYEITLPYFNKMNFIIDQDKDDNILEENVSVQYQNDEEMIEIMEADAAPDPIHQIDSEIIPMDVNCYDKDVCDEFDAIAKCMSEKLRRMNEKDENQRYLCEALINDILLRGLLEKLNENSTLVEKTNKPLHLNGLTSIYLTNTNTIEDVSFDGKQLDNQVIMFAQKTWW